ncbi:DUF2285 domain-containing protein [Bradyrhizobium sp. UFLA01-814]|uniref:DNA -binding domain-containing protein n=1 Tax=Bradyrhizobium sp. UFLA01-814 TaxID=3023480 RepID=UPI00398AA2C8
MSFELEPTVADLAPSASQLTRYDHAHTITYLRLLDADNQGADWQDIARVVLKIDPSHEPARAHRTFTTHLARAKWMTACGYRHVLRRDLPDGDS